MAEFIKQTDINQTITVLVTVPVKMSIRYIDEHKHYTHNRKTMNLQRIVADVIGIDNEDEERAKERVKEILIKKCESYIKQPIEVIDIDSIDSTSIGFPTDIRLMREEK